MFGITGNGRGKGSIPTPMAILSVVLAVLLILGCIPTVQTSVDALNLTGTNAAIAGMIVLVLLFAVIMTVLKMFGR